MEIDCAGARKRLEESALAKLITDISVSKFDMMRIITAFAERKLVKRKFISQILIGVDGARSTSVITKVGFATNNT